MTYWNKNKLGLLSPWSETSKRAPQFNGRLNKCVVKDTELDTSSCSIKPKQCAQNSKRIAELYPHCRIVEGVLHVKTNRNQEHYCRHAWNHDLTTDIFFDKTVIEDEKNNPDKDLTFSYEYFVGCEYPKEEANWEPDDEMFKFSYEIIIDKLKNNIMEALSAEALYNEGVSYFNGTGVKKDVAKAVECFEQAITVGNLPQSKHMLGAILLSPSSINGYTERDADRGTELIIEAASEGYPKAMVYVVNTFGTLSYRFVTLLHFFIQHKKFSMMRSRIALANKCKEELSLQSNNS